MRCGIRAEVVGTSIRATQYCSLLSSDVEGVDSTLNELKCCRRLKQDSGPPAKVEHGLAFTACRVAGGRSKKMSSAGLKRGTSRRFRFVAMLMSAEAPGR